MARPVVFLSDFGLDDAFVGICHGVVARASPDSRIIDLTHGVPPQDVRRGALLLARAVPYLPVDAVHLAVVDPGVGSARRPIATQTAAGAAMVGPDNGLLSLAWEALGAVTAAVVVASERVILTPTSNTFHGRDVFAPAAAHLAAGRALEDLGPSVDPSSLARIPAPVARIEGGEVLCEVIGCDRFGNVELSATAADVEGWATIRVQTRTGAVDIPRAGTFADVPWGDAAIIEDSSGWLTMSVNGGSAEERFGLTDGEPVTLRDMAGG